MDFFNMLAHEVDQRWRGAHYDDLRFADCALDVLRLFPPNEHVSLKDIAKWLIETNAIPAQTDLHESFGQPPLTVFSGGEYRIEALFWLVGLPGIHQHAFSGAFHVLEGSSLHCTYGFRLRKKLSPRLLIGDLDLQKRELLRVGSSRSILSGPDFIHATFHLARPSVSIVIRTHREQNALPQYNYLPPSIGYDPNETSAVALRRCQILQLLAASERFDVLAQSFRALCDLSDPATVFFALQQIYPLLGPQNRVKLISMTGRTHPELAAAAGLALAHAERRDKILQLRKKVSDPELQYFLALLLYLKGSSAILESVQEAFPGQEPATLLLQWIKRLSSTTDALCGLGDDWVVVVERQLTHFVPQETDDHGFVVHSSAGQRNGKPVFEDTAEHIRDHWILQPLFEQSESVVGGTV